MTFQLLTMLHLLCGKQRYTLNISSLSRDIRLTESNLIKLAKPCISPRRTEVDQNRSQMSFT